MEDKKELIIIKQLPVIEENLKKLSEEISMQVKTANELVCNDETVKEVKKVRTSFKKDFDELEKQRKFVKEEILKPYTQFEEVYKKYVSEKYKSADETLKTKIDNVENELKSKKEEEVRDYFEEYRKSKNIDFIEFGQVGINVTLSASMKSLKEKAKEFVDKVADDLILIETQEHKTEILVEYKQSLNVAQAITSVNNRFKAIEEEKTRQAELEKVKEEEKETIRKVEEVLTKPELIKSEIEKELLTTTFKVTASKEKLIELKNFLEEGGYVYE